MPWPITVTITTPDGKDRYRVYRATDAQGRYAESFPLGSNAVAGTYAIRIESPVGGLSAHAKAEVSQLGPADPSSSRVRLVSSTARRSAPSCAGNPKS